MSLSFFLLQVFRRVKWAQLNAPVKDVLFFFYIMLVLFRASALYHLSNYLCEYIQIYISGQQQKRARNPICKNRVFQFQASYNTLTSTEFPSILAS